MEFLEVVAAFVRINEKKYVLIKALALPFAASRQFGRT
jgi:hypothetical protein